MAAYIVYLRLRSGIGLTANAERKRAITEERPQQHFRLRPAEAVRLAGLQVAEDDLGRAEQQRVDLVEVAVVALEDLGERRAVVAATRDDGTFGPISASWSSSACTQRMTRPP